MRTQMLRAGAAACLFLAVFAHGKPALSADHGGDQGQPPAGAGGAGGVTPPPTSIAPPPDEASGASGQGVGKPTARAKDCYEYAKEHPGYLLIADVARSPLRFSSPSQTTYSGVELRVCIANPDYSRRYEVVVNYTKLKPPAGALSLSDLLAPGPTKAEAAVRDAAATARERALSSLKACLSEVTEQSVKLKEELAFLVAPKGPVSAETAVRVQSHMLDLQGKIAAKCAKLAQSTEILLAIPPADLEGDTNKDLKARVELLKAGIAMLPAQLKAWDEVITFVKEHIARVSDNVYTIESRTNTAAEVVVRSAPLTSQTAEDTGQIKLSYGGFSDLGRYTFEIHGLSYVRFGVAVGYTSVHGQSVVSARNNLGAEVLRVNQDLGIAPMLVLTHYWCGADERAVQPWDRARGDCWKANTFAPTLAVGLPLTSTNTLQHVFLGLVWQPLPAVGLIGGAHLGRVNRLRPEFFDGIAAPSASSGFRSDVDAVETVTRLGFFVGAVITDAAVMKLIRDAVKPKS